LKVRHRADLDETALLDHRDTIRERAGLAEIVSDEEKGAPTFGKKLPQQRDELRPQRVVDVGERLVE